MTNKGNGIRVLGYLAVLCMMLCLWGCGALPQNACSDSASCRTQLAAGSYPPGPPSKAEPLKSAAQIPDLKRQAGSKTVLSMNLTAGWNTISFPFQSISETAGFAYHIYKYNGSSYEAVDPAAHPEAIDCRLGYWAYSDTNTSVSFDGEYNRTIPGFNLNYGWNFVGVPFGRSQELKYLKLTLVEQQGFCAASTLSIPQEPGKWIYGRLYSYNGNTWKQQLAAQGSNLLEKNQGYWLWCWNDSGATTLDFTAFIPLEWVDIPAGDFTMGSLGDEGIFDERPQHTVYLDAYQIGKYEVTNAQFSAFVNSTGYGAQGAWEDAGGNLPDYAYNYPNHPVLSVSRNDALSFCNWSDCQLPTEAQWEKAARGTDARAYPWGNEWSADKCVNWYTTDPGLKALMAPLSDGMGTVPVGSIPAGASPYGVMDMAGNVSEWCRDWYQYDYYTTGGPPWINPTGPVSALYKASRNGGWSKDDIGFFRCAYRYDFDSAGSSTPSRGFRCVK